MHLGSFQSLADSQPDAWDGVNYNFVMGVHPHNAKEYNDQVEAIILEAMQHVSRQTVPLALVSHIVRSTS